MKSFLTRRKKTRTFPTRCSTNQAPGTTARLPRAPSRNRRGLLKYPSPRPPLTLKKTSPHLPWWYRFLFCSFLFCSSFFSFLVSVCQRPVPLILRSFHDLCP